MQEAHVMGYQYFLKLAGKVSLTVLVSSGSTAPPVPLLSAPSKNMYTQQLKPYILTFMEMAILKFVLM